MRVLNQVFLNEGDEAAAPAKASDDPKAFNDALAKLLPSLKKTAGVEKLNQTYKGTGKAAGERIIWVYFKNGALLDLALRAKFVAFGGVIANDPPGIKPGPRINGVAYGDLSPAQVLSKVSDALNDWANPKI